MKRSDHDKLWREVFADEAVERLRQASLDRGLAAIRNRRRTRMAVSATGAGVALALLLFTTVNRRPSATASLADPSQVPKAQAHVRVLNDEQLFALFPDRPAALVGKPGQQTLVFLDAEPGEWRSTTASQ